MSIDWWTLGLQIINFLVLVWLLQRFLYRPVLRIIARRKELAEQAFSEAETAKNEAAAARERYEQDRKDLAETRQTLLQRTHTELEEERTRLLDAAREEAEQIVAAARADLDTERLAVLTEVRTEVADLAREMSATVLSRFAETAGAGQDAALTGLAARLEALPAAERARLAEDVTTSDSPLQVVTAEVLDDERQSQWQSELLKRLETGVQLTFIVDPDLIGGAELRFPHAVLSAAWSELLNQSRDALLADESAD